MQFCIVLTFMSNCWRKVCTPLALLVWLAGLRLSLTAAPRFANSWAVEVRGGPEAATLVASKHGFINHGQIGNLRDYYHFSLAERSTSKRLTGFEFEPQRTVALESEENVGFVEQQEIKRHVKKLYTPPTDPKWGKQWALLNTGQTNGPAGLDLNVEPAWLQGITGRGVVVAFVDDGLERRHPDLSRNYDSGASWDFAENDGDPTPDYSADNTDEPNNHGTSCAGEVGMARDNGHCGVGVAYDCHIGGIKVSVEESTDVSEANALGFKDDYIDVYSNSWGPSDFGFTVQGPGHLAQRAMQTAVGEGRDGKGSIYVFAAGNGGDNYDSCAADGYTNSIYTISAGSADQSGRQADYDEKCSAKMVVTFSYNSDTFPTVDDNWDAYNQISTTTTHSLCTDGFTGTSASTPIVSGVVALTLQANPDLTWRDVQYLIAYTSARSPLSPSSAWVTNGGGLKVSNAFGFGVLDAEAMVTRAKRWINVPEQHTYSFQPSVPTAEKTATKTNPSTVTFTVSESDFTSNNMIHSLEHVIVQMSLTLRGYSTGYNYNDFYNYYYHHGRRDLEDYYDSMFQYEQEENTIEKRDIYDWLGRSHIKRGNIKIELTSPQGTKSVLLPYRKYDFLNEAGYNNWPFMSVHHWGENPVGTWTLKVSFKSSSGSVRMSNLKVKLYGSATIPEAVSSIPSQCDPACAGACSGPGPQDCDVCRQLRVNSTLECVSRCPAGTYQYKQYCLVNESAVHTTATPSVHVPTNATPHTQDVNSQTSVPKTTPIQGGGATATPSSAVQAPLTSAHVHVQPVSTSPALVKPTPAHATHSTPEHTQPAHTQPAPSAHATHSAPEHTQPAHTQPAPSAHATHSAPEHTQPAHTSPALPNDHKLTHNLKLGPIIGSVLGIVLLLSAVTVGIAIGIWCRRNRRKSGFEFVPMEEPQELNADTA